MGTFQKVIAKVLFYIISGALLIYASSRSLDFITSTLSGQDKIIGYLGLAATGGGMISWLMVFSHAADGIGQKVTAFLMILIDLLGEIVLFTFDTLYRSGQNGLTSTLSSDEMRLVVLALSGLIALNILATVAFHLVEPGNMRKMREGLVKDHLENEALKQIEKHGEEIARTLAPEIAQQWRDEFVSRHSNMESLGLGKVNQESKKESSKPAFNIFQHNPQPPKVQEALPVIPLEQHRNGNGHHE